MKTDVQLVSSSKQTSTFSSYEDERMMQKEDEPFPPPNCRRHVIYPKKSFNG